jgi:hypothetical protein
LNMPYTIVHNLPYLFVSTIYSPTHHFMAIATPLFCCWNATPLDKPLVIGDHTYCSHP